MSGAEDRGGDRYFWAAVPLGWAVMAFGLHGILREHVFTHPLYLLEVVVIFAVVHDVVVVPAALALGLALRWVLPPGPVRAVAQATLVASAVVVLIAFPALTGYGRKPDLPSLLPRNYAAGLAGVLGVVWFTGAVVLAALLARQRRQPSGASAPADGRSGARR